MRPFIQTTAGATFYVGAHYTLMFRKEYVEFIAKMQNGLYGVVNLQFYSDAVELLTDWGDFFKRIFNHEDPEKLMRMLQKPCPLKNTSWNFAPETSPCTGTLKYKPSV